MTPEASTETSPGLSFDFGAGAIIGAGVSLLNQRQQSKDNRKQINQARAEVKAGKELELAAQESEQRRQQVTALLVIGGAAVLFSGLFVAAALFKNRKDGRK